MEQHIGTKLKDLREQHGFTQTDIAQRLDVSRQTVSNWETEKSSIDLKNALLLCDLYGITINDLLDIDSKENTTDTEQSACNDTSIHSYIAKNLTLLEHFGLAVILLLTCQFTLLGSITSIATIIWLKHTKRNYVVIYVLCFICLLLDLHNIHVFLESVHRISTL